MKINNPQKETYIIGKYNGDNIYYSKKVDKDKIIFGQKFDEDRKFYITGLKDKEQIIKYIKEKQLQHHINSSNLLQKH